MLQNIRFIQDRLNGKTKTEVEAAVLNGSIAFDERKYVIIQSERTISGYIADFTDEYKKTMDNILSNVKTNDDYEKDVYIKLDSILSDGYVLNEIIEEEMYDGVNNIFLGEGKQKVHVFRFTNGECTKELLTSRGKLVKGSLTMALRNSDLIESRNDILLEKQEYVMDMFGTDQRTAAHVTTMLHKLDDDSFDDAAEKLYEFSLDVMNKLAFKGPSGGVVYAEALKSDNHDTVKKYLFKIAGSNAGYCRILAKMCKESKRYNVLMTRNLIVAGIRKHISDILEEHDISYYHNFVRNIGDYSMDCTMNISMAAEFSDMQQDIMNFLIHYGNKDDFINYMDCHLYDTVKHKAQTMHVDEKYLDRIYEAVSSLQEVSVPLSFKYVNDFIKGVKRAKITEKNKEKVIDVFIKTIAKNKTFGFDVAFAIRKILTCWDCGKNEEDTKVKFACKVVSDINTKNELKKLLLAEHPGISVNGRIFNRAKQSLERSSLRTLKDVDRIIKREFSSNYKINSDGFISVQKEICGIICKNEFNFGDDISNKILPLVYYETFISKCRSMLDEIIHKGITGQYQKDKIHADITEDGDYYFVKFADGKYNVSMDIEGPDAEQYRNYIALARTASVIQEIYKNAVDITRKMDEEEAKEKLLSFFGINANPERYPDEILSALISRNGDAVIASSRNSPEAEYIIGSHGCFLKVPELAKLQRMVRQSYCDTYIYNGILKKNRNFHPEELLKPCMNAIETGMPCTLPYACCNSNGDVYIGIHKLFHSDNIQQIMKSIALGNAMSNKKYAEYLKMKEEEEETGVSLWDAKLDLVEKCITDETISRNHLFTILHDLNFGSDAAGWLRNLLDGIDKYAADDYKAYEESLGTDGNENSETL